MGTLAKQMVAEGKKKAEKRKADECCPSPMGDEKPSITISLAIGGATLRWWKPGVGEGNAVASSLDEALEGAKAYLTAGTDPETKKKDED